MSRNRVALHVAAVLAIAVFGVMAISSGATAPAVVAAVAEGTEETIVSSVTESRGNVWDMPNPEEKAYDTLGLVFATSETKYDPEGREVSSQEGVKTMLLREAHKLGADDILNYREDRNTTFIQTTTETPARTGTGVTRTTVTTRIVTWTGSALAIKYKEKPASSGSGSSANPNAASNTNTNPMPGRINLEGTYGVGN